MIRGTKVIMVAVVVNGRDFSRDLPAIDRNTVHWYHRYRLSTITYIHGKQRTSCIIHLLNVERPVNVFIDSSRQMSKYANPSGVRPFISKQNSRLHKSTGGQSARTNFPIFILIFPPKPFNRNVYKIIVNPFPSNPTAAFVTSANFAHSTKIRE